jgi:hypothetical protein
MADRSHSQTENSRNGRHLSIETISSLVDTFKENISDNLSKGDIVKVSLDDTSYNIFNTLFKWFPYTITNEEKVKTNKLFDCIITEQSNNIVVSYKEEETLLPIDLITNNTKDEVNNITIEKFLDWSKYESVNCQSYDSFTDKLSGVLVMRESHLHQMQHFKDCVVTANNCDIDTIKALEQTKTVSLAVHLQDNNLDINGIKDHCSQSAEFIAGIIIPEDVNVTSEIVNELHNIDAYVYKQCSYKEVLDSNKFFDLGVDIIGFGPIATTDELSPYLPNESSISYGTIYNKTSHERSIAILNTLVSDV